MSSTRSAAHRSTTANSLQIVGLGASAGGLEALAQFLGAVPPDSGMAYVVVQHLAPMHTTILSELLQRATLMRVRDAKDAMTLAPDVVYVIPPDCELTVAHGRLHLGPPPQPHGMRLPIDALFISLAQEQRERAIGVVLSGMGSDGTVGLRAIKAQGGLTLAQQPETAQFDAMPRSAIDAGCVDIVAHASEMPRRIIEAAATLRLTKTKVANGQHKHGDSLGAILALLRTHCKHDFSLYKTNTLQRRIERRVGVHGLDSVGAYADFLSGNPHEIDLLFAEMLIGVTEFFRDAAAWADVESKVLPALLSRSRNEDRLRAWVVGCSTGEEAYSLAMVFKEALEDLPPPTRPSLQIFATDLSAQAITVARKGLYSHKAVEGVSPQRQERFFSRLESGFQIDKSIRDMVLFAPHDVTTDPPFTRLDMLLCRNVLIYFQSELQQRLMPLFHYSLRSGGVLMLGGSETVGRSQSLFTPVSLKNRIYLRNDQPLSAAAVDFPVNRHASTRLTSQEHIVPTTSKQQPANVQVLADQLLLQTIAPPAVLINGAGDIVYINGRTGKYLEPAAGKANWNIHVMSRPSIRTQLAVAIRQAQQDDKPVELRGLKVDDDMPGTLEITVRAIHEPKALEGMVLIIFRERMATPAARSRSKKDADTIDAAMAIELERSREEIQALRQEMQASNEELQAANEALQSVNEELQSTNEELTTTKEEAQSMNEELQTINGELQAKLDDLALAQSDMQNLLNSTDIATLFLDNDLNVRRFTEKTASIFHLRDGDIGRPLTDLANTLQYPQLNSDAHETLRTLTSSEKQIPTTDGRWFSVRIMPYRTLSNMIQGAVLTFVDITVAKELEHRLRKEG